MFELHDNSRARITNHVVVASVSGGKDSAAMSLWLHDHGIEHRRVFIDTGWEHPVTYEYIAGDLTDAIGPIETIRGAKLMPELVRSRGAFPSRLMRFCTQELKAKPIRDYLTGIEQPKINAVGIRAGESKARSKMAEWEYQSYYGCDVWRPLIAWSEEDVIAIHTRHGLRPNPLYLKGASRVGCWPCIFARKAEVRLIAEVDPERIDLVRMLEHQVGEAAEARANAKGTTLEKKGHQSPTWFTTHGEGRSLKMFPIDEAVAWSRTSRGGRQVEMFATPKNERGCMRWGLCDAVAGEE